MAQASTPSTPAATPTATPAPAASREVIGVPATAAQPTTGAGTEGKTIAPSTPAPGAAPGGGSMLFLMLPLLGFMILMIVIQAWTGRKEKKKRDEMMNAIGRNDKVVTTGGIVGHIAEIHDSEFVLRTDEASNTRIRIVKSAVASVLKKTEAAKS